MFIIGLADTDNEERDDHSHSISSSHSPPESDKVKVEDPNQTPAAKKGRRKGATKYTDGDLEALLDAVDTILPQADQDWVKVESVYSAYSLKFSRTERTANALKSRFRELSWGSLSGGGGRTEFEKRAKEIERHIDEKAGAISLQLPCSLNSPDFLLRSCQRCCFIFIPKFFGTRIVKKELSWPWDTNGI